MEKPVAYKVDRRNGKAFRAVIDIDLFRISFIEENGKIIEVARARMDGARICDYQTLSMPKLYYDQVKRMAIGILKDKRMREAQKR